MRFHTRVCIPNKHVYVLFSWKIKSFEKLNKNCKLLKYPVHVRYTRSCAVTFRFVGSATVLIARHTRRSSCVFREIRTITRNGRSKQRHCRIAPRIPCGVFYRRSSRRKRNGGLAETVIVFKSGPRQQRKKKNTFKRTLKRQLHWFF